MQRVKRRLSSLDPAAMQAQLRSSRLGWAERCRSSACPVPRSRRAAAWPARWRRC